MAGDKAIIDSQSYRQHNHVNVVASPYKAARIAGSLLSGKSLPLAERWGHTLTRYCDYFIRY